MRFRLSLLLIACCLAGLLSPGQSLAENDEDRYESLKRFSQVLDMVERFYVRDTTRKELIDASVKGMLQQLDPHSSYMGKEEFDEMQVSTSGEFSGIGIEITLQNGRLTVVSPIEDTPAFEAGLKSGDIIVEIDGESTQDISLMDAVKKIRGQHGTAVELTIFHEDSRVPEKVNIVRGTIPIISVKSETLEDGYGYLRLTRFNERTTEELYEALEDFRDKGEIKGLVLDLRNNPGGLLDQAVDVADAFLHEGMIVYIKGRDEEGRKDYKASNQNSDVTCPLVVLINAGSASASEIVAGALKDQHRALLLGERTFGKGSVQTIIPLSNGAGVKLTTALYYTPSGVSIQAEGVEPDLVYPFVEPQEKKAEDDMDFVFRERDLSRHIEGALEGKDKHENNGSAKVQEMLEKDNQLRLALQMVKKLPTLKALQ